MMNWKITNEEYIQRAKAVHGDRYGYELCEYEYGKKRIVITCKRHGQVLVNPVTHITNKSGCIECYRDDNLRKAPRDKESFIAKSKEIHGNKYDYDKVVYVNYKTPVEIVCPIHGSFWMKPFTHLQPCFQQGCKKCNISKRVKGRTGNAEEFIAKSKEIHGNKYSYDKVRYTKRIEKVVITCPIHGDFEQRPNCHLRGVGCPKCNHPHINGRTKEEVITELTKVHQGLYSYHEVPDVCNEHVKIKIKCPKHGFFKQTIKQHVRGEGCPICSNSKHANQLAKALDKFNISYIREKGFPWLRRFKRGNGLRLDFYLQDYNAAIEYQGAMHFGVHKKNRYTMNEADYKDLFDRDKIKYKLCKEHGIRVLYFCYNKEWIPDKYIDKVYSTIKELIEEIRKIKPP